MNRRTVIITLAMWLLSAAAFAQDNHVDVVQRAYNEQPPTDAGAGACAFITRLLAALPVGERAGYVSLGGPRDNTAQIATGQWVRCNRIAYPDSHSVKVLTDGASPKWDVEGPLPGDQWYLPPPMAVVVTPPPTPPPPAPAVDLTPILTRLDQIAADAAEAKEQAKGARADIAQAKSEANSAIKTFLKQYLPMIAAGLAGGFVVTK